MDEKQFKSKMVMLIDLLSQETTNNRLCWEKVEKMKYKHMLVSVNGTVNEAYIASFKGKFIAIGSVSGANIVEDRNNFFISFIDDELRAFDSYIDYEILSPFDEPKLEILFKTIRRKVNNIDQFLDELLN